MAQDYYDILNVGRNATKDEIKKAYRKVAMKYHPDKNPGDAAAEAKFKEAAEAYSVLTDDQKRPIYDQYGAEGLKGGGFNGAAGFGGFGFDPFEIFRDVFGGGGGFSGFEDLFGGGSTRRSRSASRGGGDLKIRMQLTLEEINSGVTKKVKLRRFETCSQCNGNGAKPGTSRVSCPVCQGSGEIREVSRSLFGQMVNVRVCSNCHGEGTVAEHRCPECGGDGRTRKVKEISIKVPAGVAAGNYLTMRGEGNSGIRGGSRGDLIVLFDELPHEVFVRNEDDVLMDLHVTPSEAVLGADLQIPTLNGKVKLNVPAGSQPGRMLRLRHKGLPHLHGSGKGDQIVRIRVNVPDSLSSKQKELYSDINELEIKQRSRMQRFTKIQ